MKNSGSLATDDIEFDGVAVELEVVGALEAVAVHGGVRAGEHSDRLVLGGTSVVVLDGAVAGSLLFTEMSLFELF